MTNTGDSPFNKALPWVLLTAFIFLVSYQARAIFGPLLPAIEAEFGLSHAAATRYQLYISLGYSASMFATVYTASRLRYRRLAALSNIGAGIVLAVMAAAPGPISLALLSVLLGLVTGQYFNAGMGTIRSLVNLRDWSKAVSIHEFGPTFCFLICPLLAVAGSALLGWRVLLVCLGLITTFSGLFFWFFGKGGENCAPPFRLDGMRRLLRNPLFWAFVLLMGLLIAGQFGPYTVLILHLTEDCGLSGQAASGLLSASRLAAPLAVLLGGYLTFAWVRARPLSFAWCCMRFRCWPWPALLWKSSCPACSCSLWPPP